jgi:glycosyltransferase involved in cell wall biosynthesis
LVYPSLYEGYGLVIAEGFAAKTPVIAGQGGSQAEIGGNAVRYINPTDANDIAAAMSEVLEPTIASALVAAGTKQLAALRDPAVTQRLVDYYASQAKIARKEQS